MQRFWSIHVSFLIDVLGRNNAGLSLKDKAEELIDHLPWLIGDYSALLACQDVSI